MTRIADDFPFIAKRLAELEQNRNARFFLPDGIIIMVGEGKRRLDCDICFSVDLVRSRLMVTYINKNRPDFITYLTRFFPSVRVATNAILMSADDMQLLLQWLHER